jgi:hypothetical protein
MAKIVIGDRTYDYDGSKKPMAEALTIEQSLGVRYVQYEDELQQGSMRAMAAFIWSVLHRDGQDVTIEQILDGSYEVDIMPVLQSLLEAAREAEEEDPTGTPAGSGRGGTRGTGTSTRRSSRSTTG